MSEGITQNQKPGSGGGSGNQFAPVAYIRCAARLLAIVKGLSEVCGLPMLGPANLNQMPELPNWAANICSQLSKTILKRLVELRPQGEKVDWRNAGRMLGLWQRIITFLAEAWEDAECVSPGEATAPPQAPTDSFVILPQSDLLHSMQQSLTASIVESLAQHPTAQSEFFAGLSEGHELFLDANDQFVGDRGRTQIYLQLLGHWMEIEAIRQTNPPKTRLDLYQLFAPGLGDPRHERFDWFCDVCDEIGLFVKRRGRPCKSAEK